VTLQRVKFENHILYLSSTLTPSEWIATMLPTLTTQVFDVAPDHAILSSLYQAIHLE